MGTLRNGLEAAGRVVRAAATGQPVTVPAQVAAQRLVRCMTCVQLRGERCQVCGCFVAAKARLATETCPTGKW